MTAVFVGAMIWFYFAVSEPQGLILRLGTGGWVPPVCALRMPFWLSSPRSLPALYNMAGLIPGGDAGAASGWDLTKMLQETDVEPPPNG